MWQPPDEQEEDSDGVNLGSVGGGGGVYVGVVEEPDVSFSNVTAGVCEGEGVREGVCEGEGVREGVCEGEGVREGEGERRLGRATSWLRKLATRSAPHTHTHSPHTLIHTLIHTHYTLVTHSFQNIAADVTSEPTKPHPPQTTTSSVRYNTTVQLYIRYLKVFPCTVHAYSAGFINVMGQSPITQS